MVGQAIEQGDGQGGVGANCRNMDRHQRMDHSWLLPHSVTMAKVSAHGAT